MTITVKRYRAVMMIEEVERSQISESAESGDGQRLTTTDVFDVLKNDRRRAVIRYLHEHGGVAELSDVAEHVAARENDTAVRRLTSQERKRVRIALYQCHLPRMDALGVVDFDSDRGTVALRDAASQVQTYLELDPETDRKAAASERAAFLIAVGIAAVVTAGTLGLGALSAVPPAGWTMVSVVALVGIAGRQWRA